MSYSRFGESYWYTFWACAPIDSIENRDNAIFEICPLLSFTAAELRADVDACVERAKLADLEKETTYYRGQATEFDLAELRAMMLEFVADVDAKYSTGHQTDGSKSMDVKDGFKSWAIVEVMGHQVYAGYASDASIGGQSYLRVDVPENGEQPAFTKFLGSGSIFSITPCDEETARATLKVRDIKPFDSYTVKSTARAMADQMVGNAASAITDESIPHFGDLDQDDEEY